MQILGIKRYLQNEAYSYPRFNSSLILLSRNNKNEKNKKDATVVERITGCACCNICTYLFFACFRKLQEDGVSVTTATSVAYHQRLMAQTDLILVLWAIGNGRLNTSPKLGAYTSIPSTPSSMAALFLAEGCLFSGKASSLDAFRTYPKAA